MLRHRVIPVVLLDGFSVLKTIRFDVRRNLGNPIAVARIYSSRNADELILLDIDADRQDRSIDMFTISEVAAECYMPLTVGGGIKSVGDIRKLLSKGADKVSLNSEALRNPDLVKEAAEVFGSQCIVVSIDVLGAQGDYRIRAPKDLESTPSLVDWCEQAQDLGAGELLITSVAKDGEMSGPDLQLVELVSPEMSVPLITAGGVGKAEDCASMILAGASAAAASSIFHFTSTTPSECRAELIKQGIPARPPN